MLISTYDFYLHSICYMCHFLKLLKMYCAIYGSFSGRTPQKTQNTDDVEVLKTQIRYDTICVKGLTFELF